MIPAEDAPPLIQRFATLENFPPKGFGRQELCRILTQYAFNRRHAEAVIHAWLEEKTYCPRPAELRDWLNKRRVPSECPACHDMGWVPRTDGRGFQRCRCAVDGEPGSLGLDAFTIPQTNRSPSRGEGPEHPERQLGLPFICITAKTLAVRQREARLLGYGGPLTMAQFVAAGRLTRAEADERIREWEEFHHEKFRVIEEPRLERKPAQSETPEAQSQTV